MAGIDKAQWEVVSPLLDEMLELDSGHQSARLETLRSSGPQLADMLTRLLAQQTEVDRKGFLNGTLDVRGLERGDSDELAGHVIGNYTLERPLGQGGMGSVWLARRNDGRYEGKAALKLLNLALVSRGGAQRFQREGNILARLTHPNIARLIDAGVANGQPYLVLEHVEGESIDRWCDAHALGVNARIRLFVDVLAAVSHAHDNLTLHRDLKPSNILVDRDGGVKLLDFGIAKLIEDRERPAAATELTRLAGQAFTPEYAAPEQVQGGDVTTATDVYSLGVLLYVLLTGQHPTATANTAPVDQMRSVLETEPARLSDVAMRTSADAAGARATTPPRLGRDLRGDLDNIVAKALKKAPAERYQSAAAFADDLRRYRSDTVVYRVGKFVRRYRLAVGAASAMLLALTASVMGTTWQAIEARLARANHEFVSQLFGDAMRSDESRQLRAQLNSARELLRRRFADDPVVQSVYERDGSEINARAATLDLAGAYVQQGSSRDAVAAALLRSQVGERPPRSRERLHAARMGVEIARPGQRVGWRRTTSLARVALAEDDRSAARSHLALPAQQLADTLSADHRRNTTVASPSPKL